MWKDCRIFIKARTTRSWLGLWGFNNWKSCGLSEFLNEALPLRNPKVQLYSLYFLYKIFFNHMVLMANLANTKWCKKLKEWLKPKHMGIHRRVPSESYLKWKTQWQGLYVFHKSLRFCVLEESSLGIGKGKEGGWHFPSSFNFLHFVAIVIWLTLTICWGYFHPKYKNAKIFENHRNAVMLVFIGKLSLSVLRWVAICHFSGFFCIILVLAKLATCSIRVKDGGWHFPLNFKNPPLTHYCNLVKGLS